MICVRPHVSTITYHQTYWETAKGGFRDFHWFAVRRESVLDFTEQLLRSHLRFSLGLQSCRLLFDYVMMVQLSHPHAPKQSTPLDQNRRREQTPNGSSSRYAISPLLCLSVVWLSSSLRSASKSLKGEGGSDSGASPPAPSSFKLPSWTNSGRQCNILFLASIAVESVFPHLMSSKDIVLLQWVRRIIAINATMLLFVSYMS